MEEHLKEKLRQILTRYEKLELQDSQLYKQLKRWSVDEQWLKGISSTFEKVRNAEKIFDVVGQLNKDEADHRLMTMFAEYDTAIRLTDWAKSFFGNFTDAEYMPRKNKRQPDFKVWNREAVMPVEAKAFKGTDEIESNRFNAKVIRKIRDDALPQLASFYEDTPFERGIIFIWTQQRVKTEGIRHNAYLELKSTIAREIDTREMGFDTQAIVMFSNPLDLWDFDLYGKRE